MAEYTFTTDQGWRVTEYRPFSASYGVLHTPCIRDYLHQGESDHSECAGGVDAPEQEKSLIQRLIGQQLKFDGLAQTVLRQLLEERVAIRDRNRSSILGRIADVSGEIYSAFLARTPDSDRRKQGLEKTKLDLERDLRETDERLWADTSEIREKLILAAKKNNSTQTRSTLFTPDSVHDATNQRQDDNGSSG